MNFFFEALGWIGSYCFLFSYYMLITKRWHSQMRIYHWYNIIGSFLFVLNGLFYEAWAVIFINFAWGLIAFYGLYQASKSTTG